MSYTPRGKVKIIIDHMGTQDAGLQWSTEELASVGSIRPNAVSSQLKAAIKNGLVFRQKFGRGTAYSLTPFETEAEPEVEPAAFNARRWMDGDIDLYGLLETEDGGHRLPADKVSELMKLLGGVAC